MYDLRFRAYVFSMQRECVDGNRIEEDGGLRPGDGCSNFFTVAQNLASTRNQTRNFQSNSHDDITSSFLISLVYKVL